jgi:hypothetical protein
VLTAKERDLMEHALGRDYPHKSKDYRNYYAASREGADFKAWMSLVDRGLATKRTDVAWTPCAYFGVTDAGKAELDGVIAPPAPPAYVSPLAPLIAEAAAEAYERTPQGIASAKLQAALQEAKREREQLDLFLRGEGG